jgi:uncharacterized protein YndB with AHSA1/START domain
VPEFTIKRDLSAASLTVEVLLPTSIDQAFQLWSDPRLLEQWWGPPGYPCTVDDFNLTPGGTVSYAMTGPDGERYPGWWQVIDVEPPFRIHLRDGFGESPTESASQMPVSDTVVTFRAEGDNTNMQMHSSYDSQSALQQVLDLGMEEGLSSALMQIDDLLRAPGQD